MSRRKYKIEKLKLYLRKNVFSMKFPVRNLMVLMVSFAFVFMAVTAVSSLNNAKSGDKTADSSIGVAGTSSSEEAVADAKNAADDSAKAETEAVTKAENKTDTSKVDTTKEEKAAKINKSKVDVKTVAESKYDMTGKFIVTEDLLNVRCEADMEADILGLLSKGTIGEIVSTDGVWTEVKTDNVSGYVMSEFILTGDKASELAEKFDKHPELLAPSDNSEDKDDAESTDNEDADLADADSDDTDSDDNDSSDADDTDSVDDTDNSDDYSDDDTDDYSDDTDDVEDTEEITTEEVTEEPTEEVTEEETTEPETSEEVTTEEVTTEEITTTEETEEPTEEETTEHVPSTDDLSIHEAGGFSADDVRLLAAIVYAESGSECYEGQVAVANVVLNRLYTGSWGSSLYSVIYAPYQFTATDTWAFSDAFNNGAPETTMSAVYDALNGYNNIGSYLSFRPTWYIDPDTIEDHKVIGNHCFF